MIICELEFNAPDSENPDYSQEEIDYFAWTPIVTHKDVPNHRLSLRKNLRTGKFELYRRFFEPVRFADLNRGYAVATGIDTGLEQVIFSGSLAEAVHIGNKEYEKFHGDGHDDKVCEHRYPNIATFCPKGR